MQANKYTASQNLPDAPPPLRAASSSSSSSTALKRSRTWDDGLLRGRHSELFVRRTVFSGREGKDAFMPHSLLRQAEGGVETSLQEQHATRAKTVGWSAEESEWSQHSGEWSVDLNPTNRVNRMQQDMNITDFLC